MGDDPSRSKVASDILFRSVVEELNYWSRSWFKSQGEKSELKRQKQEKLGHILVDGLSRLRGTGLKVLQNLALDEDMVPPELLKKFEQSFAQVKPLNPFVVRKILVSEFGSNWGSMFLDFDTKATAAASIGQVHRAQTPGGVDLAVKLQYPHVARDVESEMKLLVRLTSLIENRLIKDSVDSVARQFLEEVDYVNEVKNIEWVNQLQLSDSIQVARCRRDLCRPKVVVTEWIEGRHLLEFERDSKSISAPAQLVFEFFFELFFDHGAIYGDPHPGNFLVTPSGQLGVVDFGLLQTEISSEARNLMLGLLGSRHIDEQQILNLYRVLGARVGPNEEREFLQSVVNPFQDAAQEIFGRDNFDFKGQSLKVKALRNAVLSQSSNTQLSNFSSELALIHRALQNLLLTLCRLGAVIDTHLPQSI